MTDARNRKLIAKRFNEHVKLLATLFNALSIATFGAAFVVPLTQGQASFFKDGHWILLLVALTLHIAGHIAIRFMRSED